MTEGSPPLYVRLEVEVVARVVDPVAVRHAAHAEISRVRAQDPSVPESEWGPVDDDIAAAVLAAVEPDDLLIDGLEPDASSVGAQLCDSEGRTELTRPPFAELFEVCECGRSDCLDCGGWQLTPRMAARLWVAAQVLADRAFDDVIEYGDAPVTDGAADWWVFDEFPRITWGQDAVWRRQAARSFDDLASDLAAGRWPQPTCPAEEMALRLVLAEAAEAIASGVELEQVIKPLPPHSDDDDFRLAFEVLFQDDDLDTLFHPSLDGIEDVDDQTNQTLGMGDYRPRAWFKPFLNVTPRDPRRPFRR